MMQKISFRSIEIQALVAVRFENLNINRNLQSLLKTLSQLSVFQKYLPGFPSHTKTGPSYSAIILTV